MSDVTGSDITQGPEVKWYVGGAAVHETITATAGQTSVTLADTAEYGTVVVTINGVIPATVTETGTEAGGTTAVTFTAATLNDAIDVYYVKIEGAALTHVATCQDVKFDANPSIKTAAVHGQATKLNSVGPVENSGELEEFYYSYGLLQALIGDYFADSPLTGGWKWTNKFTGSKKAGALVGKRYNTSGTVLYKIVLVGAQLTGLSGTYPTEDMYRRSVKFSCDYIMEVDLS